MECMRTFISRVILSVIDAEYSVSSWLWIIVSTITAAFLLFLIIQGTAPGLDVFLQALPFEGGIWSGLLLVTGLVKMYGMAWKNKTAIRYGSLVAVGLWAFGAVTFVLIGQAQTVFLLIAPIMVFNIYLFLTSSFRTNKQA